MIDMEDNSHLKNVISLPCLRRTDLVGSLGESDWSELRLEKKVMILVKVQSGILTVVVHLPSVHLPPQFKK